MPQVRDHKNTSGDVVSGVYDRIATEGDAAQFVNAESGHRQLLHIDDASQLADGTNVVTEEAAIGAHLFQLNFDYIVGAKQLEVLIANSDLYASDTTIELIQVPSIEERNVALSTNWTGPDASEIEVYFEEIGSSTVRVYGVPSPGIVLFRVPHTSIPASSRNKIIVEDQGDNVAIEMLGEGDGTLMRSPNGSKWLMTIDDSGTIVVEPR